MQKLAIIRFIGHNKVPIIVTSDQFAIDDLVLVNDPEVQDIIMRCIRPFGEHPVLTNGNFLALVTLDGLQYHWSDKRNCSKVLVPTIQVPEDAADACKDSDPVSVEMEDNGSVKTINGKAIVYWGAYLDLLKVPEEQKSTRRYCWLKMPGGEFSNSWDQEAMDKYGKGLAEDAKELGHENWKLIEYTCINDEAFEFTDKMKLR